MISIEQKRSDRFSFMKKLYELTDGNQTAYVEFDSESFGKDFGWESSYFESTYQYLRSEGLITNQGITHLGVIEIEEALSNPNQPTEHFPAFNVVNNHYHISGNSQTIVQTGNQNTASLHISKVELDFYESLESLLGNVLVLLENINAENAELRSDYETLKAQLASPHPKKSILAEVARSIKTVAEGALGGVISNVISGPQILELLSKLPL